MHGITRFNANGQTFDIPETAAPDFLKDAPEAQRTRRFTAGGNTFDIPDGEADGFLKDAPDAVETRTIGYRGADGADKTVDVPLADLPRFLRENYERDEEYAADRAERQKAVEARIGTARDESPLWAGVKGFADGLLRSVTDSAALWEETYGNNALTDALKGANANANKIVNGILGIPSDVNSTLSMATGGANTAVGRYFKENANAGRTALEETFPSRISDAVGYEDWGTIAGDKIGDISATIIKFAAGDKDPTKFFNPFVVSTAAADSYAQTYDQAIAHGKSVDEANYLANGSATWNALLTMFLMRAFKGEAQAVTRDLGTGAKAVAKREIGQAARTGNVMGVQGAGNAAINANVEGRTVTPEEVATGYIEGLKEGAIFHGVNALGAQISEYGHNTERRAEWVDSFKKHIIDSNTDREMYLRTPMGDPMRSVCESVQNGVLPDRKAFVSAGIPKELCKTEAQRREIAGKFMETMQLSADANRAEAVRRVYEMTPDLWPNAYARHQEEIASNTVPTDRRLWNGRKVVAERVDLGDGKFGYDFYNDAGDGTRKLVTTSDEPLLADAYRDATNDLMNFYGMERPKQTGKTIEEPLLRDKLAEEVKQEQPTAKEVTDEEAVKPQGVRDGGAEPGVREPEAAEVGGRDERMAAGDQPDAASRGAGEPPVTAETPQAKPVAQEKPSAAPKAQPKALASANAEAKTADARRAAKMETPALEDEIANLESIGNLSKKGQRQLAAYKAELAQRTDADKAAKAEAFNAPAFEVGENGEKVAIGPKAETTSAPKTDGRARVVKTAKTTVAQNAHQTPSAASAPKEAQPTAPTAAKRVETASRAPDAKPVVLTDGEGEFAKKAYDVTDAILMDRPGPEKARLTKAAREALAEQAKKESTEDLLHTFNMTVGGTPPTDRKGWNDYFGMPTATIGTIITRELESRGYKYNKKTGNLDKIETKQSVKPVEMTAKDAAALLGADAYDKATLTEKLRQWERHPTEANAKHREAAKLMLGKLEGPQAEPVAEETAPQAEAPSSPVVEKPVAPAKPKRRPGKKAETAAAPVDEQYVRAVKAVEVAEKESANARSFDELSNIQDRARSSLGRITMEQENELMARLDKAWKDNKGRVEDVRSQGDYTPSKEIIEAKSRIEAMPTFTSREKSAKKKAQKDWLLSSVDDAIKSHGDTRTINGKPFAESFADEFESLIRRRNSTYERDKLDKLNKQIGTAKKTMAQGEMLTFDVPDDGTFKIRNNPKALAVFKRMVQKRLSPTNLKEGTLANAEKPLAEDVNEANIGEKQSERTKESRRPDEAVDPAKLEDPAFREWSAKRGTKSDDAAALACDRVTYDLDQATEAAKRTGNWLGLKIVRETNADALPEGAKVFKDAAGKVVGWYDPATKEVHLKPGADAKTIAHELGWHATYDWAKQNNPTLARTMEQYAANAPEALKAEIKKLYGRDLTPAELLEEIGAGRFEREHGRKLQKLLADRANRKWYTKIWDGIKDAYKAVLTKLGFNRVNLDEALQNKTPEQAMDFLASALARGKALGKMRPGKAREGARPMAAVVPVGPVGTVDPQTRLNKRELLVRSIKDSDIALRRMDELDGRYANGNYADNSIHMAKKLLPGLREAAIQRRDRYENAIAKIMREHRISVGNIDDYLLSVAVPERNARLAANGVTDGAGLTNAEAAALDANLRATLTPTQYGQVKRCAHILWAMQKEGMEARIASGRVARDVYASWNAAEPHHIPMRTDYSELAGTEMNNYSTGGYKRNDFKSAHGRTDRASSPTAFIFDEYTDARLSSLDNDLRVKLADFVRLHPEIGRIASANRVDNGFVILGNSSGRGLKVEPKREQYGKKPQRGEDPNLILFKEGGELHAIELNGDFGTQIADAITDRMIYDFAGWGPQIRLVKFGAKDENGTRRFVQATDKRALGDWIKSASSAYASTATKWSPTFMARNFVKDQIELNLQNIAEYGFKDGAKAARKQLVNSIGSVAAINRYLTTKKFDRTTESGRWLERYVKAGGQIGGAGNEGYSEFKRRFDGFDQATEKSRARKIVDTVVRANEISEMMNRLANFRTACESGLGDQQAALKSRNDSVDFNSFGRAKWMNTVWNFSNSVTGGTMRQMYSLTRKHGKKLALSLFAYGFAEGLAEVIMNQDDDEREAAGLPSETSMTEYQRANAAYVRRGDKFYRLPIHSGVFSTIKYAGNGAARMMFGKLNWEEYANALWGEARDTAKHFTGTGDVAGGDSTFGTFNIGGRGEKFAPLPNLSQSFAPSTAQGFVQLGDYGPKSPREKGTGLTFAGTPLRNRSFNDYEPQAYNGREMTAAPYKWAAQTLNNISGGNEHRKGNWDLAPEDIKVINEAIGKNLFKDTANVVNLVSLLTEKGRADFRVGNIPFVGDFVRNVPENDTRYYEALDRFSADQNERRNLPTKAEQTAFDKEHRLHRRIVRVQGQPGKERLVEEKSEAEQLVDSIKNERNLVKNGEKEFSVVTGTPGHERIVRKPRPHEYTPDEREAADRERRKKQAKFIRLTREEDKRRGY